jgi:serine/threonine protein kinase
VVDVTDFGFSQARIGQVAYLVMEYLDGCTLGEVLSEEPKLPQSWVVDILEQVCSAVDEAHRRGIVHRDLKPENIWLEPNRRGGYTVKVLDFGLVKLGASINLDREDYPAHQRDKANAESFGSIEKEALNLSQSPAGEETITMMSNHNRFGVPMSSTANASASDSSPADLNIQPLETQNLATSARSDLETANTDVLTRVGSVMGTPAYMSPEQWRGEPSDAKSDIYSLGVIAYRMLTGESPFSGTHDDLRRLHTTREPRPIREMNPRLPKRMASIIMAALAKEPRERPASAAGFASTMRASAEGTGALLRHSISLYSEQFPNFLKISFLAYVPLIAVLGFFFLSDRVISWERVSPLARTFAGPFLFVGMILGNLLAYFVVSAVTVPIVVQLMIAPLRQVEIGTALAILRKHWWVFSLTSLVVMAMILVGAAFLIVPGAVVAVSYALCAPVAVMEGSGVWTTLKRARLLMKASWDTVLITTLLQFTLPVLVWVASVDSHFTFRLADNFAPKELGFGFNMSGSSPLYQLVNIVITPLTAIMTALLYLKTRLASGESLRDAVERLEALEIPRSRWQARMRTRSGSSTANPSTPLN